MARILVHALERPRSLPFTRRPPAIHPGLHPHAITGLRFALPRAVQADVHVLDPAGRRIRTLACGELGPGEHECGWDGRDDRGERCPSGRYLLRLETDGSLLTSRIVAIT